MPPAEAWPLLTDVARVAPCMPGARLSEAVDADTWCGELAVRLGPVGIARSVPMSQWTLGYMTPALEPDELLVRVRVPSWPPGHGFGFSEVARRHGDFAMAGAGVLVQMDGDSVRRCSIALVGVDDGPVRLESAEALLTGNPPTPDRLDAAVQEAYDVSGIEDVHASAAYRRKIAAVVTRRALDRALERTGAEASPP